jgi:hypothetical protein
VGTLRFAHPTDSQPFCLFTVVIAGHDPAIHSVTAAAIAPEPEWMPGSSPGMTT